MNCFAYVEPASSNGSIAVALIASQDYGPLRVAASLVMRALQALKSTKFYAEHSHSLTSIPPQQSLSSTPRCAEGNTIFAKLLSEYQDPVKADKVLRVQQELDETKQIIFTAMECLLQRHEKLEDVVEK